MAYTMKVCEGANNSRSFQGPLPETIDQALDDLVPAMYHYVILEAKPPQDDCAYVQTLIEYEGKNKGRYLVETRYIFPGSFRHYRKHVADVGEVKMLFRKFAEGTAPNVAGWEDITERMDAVTA